MEHFIRTAFWIVTLSVSLGGCYPTLPVTDWNIDLMRDEVRCPEDSKFSTPENVLPECNTAAMQCVQVELQTAQKKCNDTNERIDQAIEILTEYVEELPIPNNCVCEKRNQKSFSDFLEKYKTLTEQFNAIESGRVTTSD